MLCFHSKLQVPNKLTKPYLLLSCSCLLQGVQDATQTTIFLTWILTHILHNSSIRPCTSKLPPDFNTWPKFVKPVPKRRKFRYLTIATRTTWFGVTERVLTILAKPCPKTRNKFQQKLPNFKCVFRIRF